MSKRNPEYFEYIVDKIFALMPDGSRRWVSVKRGVARWGWKPPKMKQKQFKGRVKKVGKDYRFEFESSVDKRLFLENHRVVRRSYEDRSPEAVAARYYAYITRKRNSYV